MSSLLDLPAAQWAERAGPKNNSYPAFLAFAATWWTCSTRHRLGGGVPRDIWRLDRLPGLTPSAANPNPRNRIRFDRIAQPWLRPLVKRWSRLRLSSGLTIGTVATDVIA